MLRQGMLDKYNMWDKFYKDQIKLLKPEAEYHDLLASIEEAKTRQIHAMHQSARIFAANDEGEVAPDKKGKKD